MLTIVEDASPAASVAEQLVMARSWSRMLEPIIPVLRLQEVWEFAFRIHATSFDINHYDLKNAWAKIVERDQEREAKRDKSPIELCSGKAHHALNNGRDIGETIAQNPFTLEDERMPCPLCRKDDERKWFNDQKARFGEIKIKQLTPEQAIAEILQPAEIYLTPAQAEPLAAEYNRLVRELAGDEAAKDLIVVFDEGANRFHHPGRWQKLYRREDLERMISDYSKRLEEQPK